MFRKSFGSSYHVDHSGTLTSSISHSHTLICTCNVASGYMGNEARVGTRPNVYCVRYSGLCGYME